MGWFTKEPFLWVEGGPNIAMQSIYGDPVTFEDIEKGIDIYHHEFKMPKQGKTWAEVRPSLADQPPSEWFTGYQEDWKNFVSSVEPGSKIYRFYFYGGFLAERGGLVIVKDDQYIGALITWLS